MGEDLGLTAKIQFYVSCGEKEEDTRRVLSEALAWRLKYNYGNLLNEDYSAHERERKLYFISRAKIGYPVLVWKSQRHYAKKHKYTESIRFIVQTIEKAIRGGYVAECLEGVSFSLC